LEVKIELLQQTRACG